MFGSKSVKVGCLFFGMAAALLLLATLNGEGVQPAWPIRALPTGVRWISYAPTHFYPSERPPVMPSDASIRADLRVLRQHGFDGLITYGAAVESIPRLAHDAGFRSLLLGIWDPQSERERLAASAAAQNYPDLISGIIVGNEGILRGEYDAEQVCDSIARVRELTHLPVSTTETPEILDVEPKLARCSDFLTVNLHPFFHGTQYREPHKAVAWTVATYQALRRSYPEQALLVKECGLPSTGDDELTEANQARYYQLLAVTSVRFSYFEAFDASPRFKQGRIEQSWGLFYQNRKPKLASRTLPWNVTVPTKQRFPR